MNEWLLVSYQVHIIVVPPWHQYIVQSASFWIYSQLSVVSRVVVIWVFFEILLHNSKKDVKSRDQLKKKKKKCLKPSLQEKWSVMNGEDLVMNIGFGKSTSHWKCVTCTWIHSGKNWKLQFEKIMKWWNISYSHLSHWKLTILTNNSPLRKGAEALMKKNLA